VGGAVLKPCRFGSSLNQADVKPPDAPQEGQLSPPAVTFNSLAAPVQPHAHLQDVSRLPSLAAPDELP
jgi:hypothetical protein